MNSEKFENEICRNCENWKCIVDDIGHCCNSTMRGGNEYTQNCSYFRSRGADMRGDEND